jgi:hypothetical protein
MNYFFGNQRKQKSIRSKSQKCQSLKVELLPDEKLQTKYQYIQREVSRLNNRGQLQFTNDRVQSLVNERLQAIASKVLEKR